MKMLSKEMLLGGCLSLSLLSCSTLKTGNPGSLNGEWNVTELLQEKIKPTAETPFIGFKVDEARIYGSTGCNRIMGEVNAADLIEGKADLSKIATTMMACPDNKYERTFLDALSTVKKVESYKSGFKLLDGAGKVVMVLTEKSKDSGAKD